MNNSNVARASAVAVVTAVVLAFPYAMIVKATSTNFSYLSIGVGFAVGLMVQRVGKASGVVVGVVAAVATFVGSMLADALAIKWIVADKLGIDVSVTRAAHAIRPLSWGIFAIGAFVAFSAAGGRHELQQRSAAAGAGRFTPATMPQSPTLPPVPASTPGQMSPPIIPTPPVPTTAADGAFPLPPHGFPVADGAPGATGSPGV